MGTIALPRVTGAGRHFGRTVAGEMPASRAPGVAGSDAAALDDRWTPVPRGPKPPASTTMALAILRLRTANVVMYVFVFHAV